MDTVSKKLKVESYKVKNFKNLINLEKFYKIYIFFILLLQFNSVFGQFYGDSIYLERFSTKRNILKTNPFVFPLGSIPLTSEFRIAYETVLSQRSSIQISGSYLGKGLLTTFAEAATVPPIVLKVRGFRFQAEYKYYLLNHKDQANAPKGLYVSLQYSYSRARITDKKNILQDEYILITYTNYCFKTGFQIINKNLAFDPFIGIGYRDNVWLEHFNNVTSYASKNDYEPFPGPLKILLGFNAGWAF